MAAPGSSSTPAAPIGTSSAQVKQAVRIPVIVNGDILTEDDAAEALRRSGADGVMIGRGCYGRPWFPAQVAHFLRTGGACRSRRWRSRNPSCLEHYHAMLGHFGTTPGCGSRASMSPGIRAACPARPSSAPTVNRLTSAASGASTLIDAFYDPLIARGAVRMLPGGAPTGSRGRGRTVARGALAVIARATERQRLPDRAALILGALPVPVVLLDRGEPLPLRQPRGRAVPRRVRRAARARSA